MTDDEKTLLALDVVEHYSGLERAIGYNKASEEMAFILGEYVLRGELNQFEVDMIATIAILGHVTTHALNENERLRSERTLGE